MLVFETWFDYVPIICVTITIGLLILFSAAQIIENFISERKIKLIISRKTETKDVYIASKFKKEVKSIGGWTC